MKKKLKQNVLDLMRGQVKEAIKESYKTVEEFCWTNNLSKATVSNFLHGKKDFQVSTLLAIACALEKKLVIRLE